MTREEAKRSILINQRVEVAQAVIDEIYDDFESRTCKSCKYYTELTDYPHHCGYHESYNLIFTKHFGCNKFEQKE